MSRQDRIAEQLRTLTPGVRSTVQAARRAVRDALPDATEIPYRGGPPRSKSAMWKLVRYAVGGHEGYVVAIGAFADHVSLFFPRGSELENGDGLLQGGGKTFRFITLRTPSDAGREDVRRILGEAAPGRAPR